LDFLQVEQDKQIIDNYFSFTDGGLFERQDKYFSKSEMALDTQNTRFNKELQEQILTPEQKQAILSGQKVEIKDMVSLKNLDNKFSGTVMYDAADKKLKITEFSSHQVTHA
jgi:Rps23 Pro-64 3,4-dihydroxylase Tpa1-like proline 4-hydroxylase